MMNSIVFGDITSWDSAIRSPLVASQLGNSFDFVNDALPLASLFETTQVQTIWTILSLASAAFAPRVTLQDPVSGVGSSLALGTILVGPHGRWHDAVKRFVWMIAREVGINADSSDTGGEKAGAVAMLRRNRGKELTPESEEVELLGEAEGVDATVVQTIEDLAALDTSALTPVVERVNPRTSIYHTPSELTAFFNPQRADLYHHIYSGMQQEILSSSQKQHAYFLSGITLSLFATTTRESLSHVFPASEVYIKHMARCNLVYTGLHPVTDWVRYGKLDITENIESLKTRLAAAQTTGVRKIQLDSEAFKYFNDYRQVGVGRMSRQIEAYQATRPNHLLRIAALVALLRDSDTQQVNLSDIRLADFLLFGTEEKLQALYFTTYMGINGKVLSAIIEGLNIFKQGNKPLTYDHAKAWCVTSGIPAKTAADAIEQLTDAKIILALDGKPGLHTIFESQENNLTAALRRMGMPVRLKAFA